MFHYVWITVKGVNFFGPKSEFVVSGSDCGNVYLWHRESEKIVNHFHADDGGVVRFQLGSDKISLELFADKVYCFSMICVCQFDVVRCI